MVARLVDLRPRGVVKLIVFCSGVFGRAYRRNHRNMLDPSVERPGGIPIPR